MTDVKHISEIKEFPDDVEEQVSNDSPQESVDPRVQIELERLNTATDLINKLEIELDEARSSFRMLLSESSQRVNSLAKKLGSCVERARPYYEARMHAKQLQTRTQKAALRYERASSAHCAAKEMVYLAEEGLKKEGRCFDPAWQEMLNHATMRVNEAESERVLSQQDHQQTSLAYNEAEKNVQQLHQDLKRAITKSSLSTRRSLLQLNNLANQHQLQLLPYFEMKAQFNQMLEEQRKKVHHLEENVLKVKMSYADALHNLEEISDEIHQKRKIQDEQITSEKRSDGVGAESPDSTWNTCVKIPYLRHMKRSVSSENLFTDAFNVEDAYKTLPSKLSPRSAVIATTSIESDSKDERKWKTPCQLPVLFQKVHLQDIIGENRNSCSGSVFSPCTAPSCDVQVSHYSDKELPLKLQSNQPPGANLVADNLQQLSLTPDHIKLDFNKLTSEVIDRSPEGAEMPDQKFQAPDLNILRVQREDLSDSESLASNDTADTLDDNQIECLLLDRMLPIDFQDVPPQSDDEIFPMYSQGNNV